MLIILVIIGVASYKNLFQLIENNRLATKNRVILKKLEVVLTKITDAETGQRGYIITGDERYLEPYHVAIATIDQEMKELRKLIVDNPNHEQKLDALEPLISKKFIGLKERIDLRKNQGFEAAAKEVRSGKGRTVMDNIRKIISDMEDNERNLLEQRAAEAETSAKRTIFIIIFGSSLAFVTVGIASFITYRELTEHKRAEEAMQESEKRFRAIFDTAQDSIFIKDCSLRYLLVNPAMEQLFNLPAAELIGKRDEELFGEEAGKHIKEIDFRVLKGEIIEEEYTKPAKGVLKTFHIIKVPMQDNSGKVTGLCGIARDVTERKRAEEELQKAYDGLEQKVIERTAQLNDSIKKLENEVDERKQIEELLKKSETRLNSILSSIDDLIFVLDREGRFTFFRSPSSMKLYVPPGKFMGEKHSDVMPPHINNLIVNALNKNKNGEVAEFDYWLKVAGENKCWSAKLSPLFLKSEFLGSVAVIREITERKGIEKKLRNASNEWRTTFDSTSDLIMLLDKEMNIIKANLATARFLNKPINEILGKNCFQIFHGTDKPCDVCPLEKVEKTKKREESEVYLSERGIWLRVSVDPILDDKGNLTGSVNISRDITERKEAEEKLQIYQEHLRALASKLLLVEESERKRIATDIHDNIGQILTFSKIKLGALKELATSPSLVRVINEIRELTDQAIQYTRSLTFELSPPILYELGFEAAIEWLGEQIIKKQGMQFTFQDDGQPKLMDNETRVFLFQAVRELLLNSAKHSQANTVTVSICKEDNNIRINVEDDGIGFDTSKIDTVRGFGFFSIRERLNYIGGHLKIKSEPGHGTLITIIAPLKEEE